MKFIGWMNGWAVAPQCWRRFLFQPVHVEQTPRWTSVSVFGFVVFLAPRPNAAALPSRKAPGAAQGAAQGTQPGEGLPTPCLTMKTPENAE